MMKFAKKALKRIKLFVLYWTRIVFVKNVFDVSLFTKIRANIFGGYLGDQYILYDFKNNNKNEYLSEFDWYRSRYINAPFDFAFNNKVICSEILKHYVRVADNYFIKNKGYVFDFDKGKRSYDDIIRCLIKKGRLVIKPFAMGKGNGVSLLGHHDGMMTIDGETVKREDVEELLQKRNDYVICEFMDQNEYSSSIYDKTVNTIRLITIRDIESHDFKVFFAVQRIGTENTIPVDNGSKGGLIAKIDLETGELSEARSLHDLNIFERHPDSGNPIKGIKVPDWNKIKEEILRVCDKLPYMEFIAWDLLVTDEGICVIEANASSGVNIIQVWGGQRQGELGDFFRHHKVIK